MKRLVCILLALCFACGSSDDSSDNTSNFSFTATTNNTAIVDEVILVTITSDENIMSLEASRDNFETNFFNQVNSTGFGTSAMLYLSFDKLGSTTVNIKAKNASGDEATQNVTVNITKGNAVKINQVQVLSFSNIDGTWDDEYASSDINHLADVSFVLLKRHVEILDNFSFPARDFHRSTIKMNQGDLTWDVSSKGLYLDPEAFPLQFALGDDDGGGFGQDLMLGPPFTRDVSFSEHIATQPNTITLNVPHIDLQVLLTLEW